MGLTYGEFKRIIAPYAGRAGKCANPTQPTQAKEIDRFARTVMEYLLYSGSTSAIRKVNFMACKGCISMPPEVEVPVKARIDRRAASLWSKWYTMGADTTGDMEECCPAGQILMEDGAETPLAFQLPECGSRVAVLGSCDEDEESHVIVQGNDPTGRPIYTTNSKGEQVPGETFKIKKNEARYGQVAFGNITGIVKSRTNGYVSLLAYDEIRKEVGQFLADWSPSEERPLYRRFRVISRDCPSIAHVSVLCRVRLRDNYLENELTLFDNTLAIMLAAQRVQSEVNGDVQTATYKKQATEDILEKEAGYKRVSGGQISVYGPLSGGSIKNIVGCR